MSSSPFHEDATLRLAVDTLIRASEDTHERIDGNAILQSVFDRRSTLTFSRHPLGFVHVELTGVMDLPVQVRARLHLWDNAAGTIDVLGDRHNHPWDLTSWLLVGGLEDTTWSSRRVQNGEYIGSRVIYGDRNRFERVGEFDLVGEVSRVIRPGDIYTIPAGKFHESRVITVPSATLLVTVGVDIPSDVAPIVLQNQPKIAAGTAVRRSLSQQEIAALATSYLERRPE